MFHMTVRSQLQDFLSNLPDFQTKDERRTLIYAIGFNSLQSEITWDGNAQSFVGTLLTVLAQQGQEVLNQFLTRLKQEVGGLDKQERLAELSRDVASLTSEE